MRVRTPRYASPAFRSRHSSPRTSRVAVLDSRHLERERKQHYIIALALSHHLRGCCRLGESGANLTVLPGIDTVDVTRVDLSFLGHSYYGDEVPVLGDIGMIINCLRVPPPRPHLVSRPQEQGPLFSWVYDPLNSHRKDGYLAPCVLKIPSCACGSSGRPSSEVGVDGMGRGARGGGARGWRAFAWLRSLLDHLIRP
jgi:hypothetical protein